MGRGGVKTLLKARAVTERESDRDRQTDRQICAAKKLLLVKILFEEVSFKASFEGREGRAVTESGRKRIPDMNSREAERPPCCFLLQKGMQKVLLSEEECRDLEGM